MPSPDLDALARVSHLSAVTSPSGSLGRGVPVMLFFSLALAGSAQCRAQKQAQQSQDQLPSQTQEQQSVAEAARQERARKQDRQNQARHVYTVEDLKREHILTPEDRAEFEARKNQPPAPAGPPPLGDGPSGTTVAQDAPSATAPKVPLGDLARRLRRQKQSQQLERSVKFPLPFADAPVLASPQPAQPLLPSLTVAPPTAVLPAPRVVAPSRPFVKRSPFERPRLLPAPRALSPAPHALRKSPAQVAPLPGTSAELATLVVQPGDSLWKLAAARLGDGRRWQELLTLNPGLAHPERLEVGSSVVVPASPASPRARRPYAVRGGDTLWTIAQAQLGHGTAWSCIAHANPDLGNANILHEGQLLLLPASCLP